MKKIRSKMKELECSQDFSHYKSMGIFPNAQGQFLVESGLNSNLSEILWQITQQAWSDLAEFRTRPRCYECSCYLQV